MKLREIAFSRSGDKGNTCNVVVFPYDDANWPLLQASVTVERVGELFGELVKGSIVRYELPGTCGLNFVMTEALEGGAANGLLPDPWGKAFQSLILDLELPE